MQRRVHRTGCFSCSAFGFRFSAFVFRLSAFVFRLSAFGFRLSAFGFRLLDFGFSAFRLSGKQMENYYQLARPFHSDLKSCLTMGKPEVKLTIFFIRY